MLSTIKKILADVALLKRPLLASTLVADVIAIISPFGINVGSTGVVITSALVAVGALAAFVEEQLA